MTFTYDYPRPGVATDVAVFALRGGQLDVLLIERGVEPYAGAWALPGGFLQPNEDLETCARRELLEETEVEASALRHVQNFSAPDRDPRWVVSAAYFALLPSIDLKPRAGTDARNVKWFAIANLPELAFDHATIFHAALAALRKSAGEIGILLALLPPKFTLTELQVAHDAILGLPPEDRNKRKAHFRKSAKASGWIRETDEFVRGSHRPAQLFAAVQNQDPYSAEP